MKSLSHFNQYIHAPHGALIFVAVVLALVAAGVVHGRLAARRRRQP